jgi:hypothetical protein
VTVTTATLVGLQVTPAILSIPANTTQQLSAFGVYSDSTTVDITNSGLVSWIAINSATATVTNAGLVTGGASPGQTNISASIPTIPTIPTAYVSLNVTQTVLETIQVTASSSTVPLNTSTVTLTAIGTYSDHTTVNITNQVGWTTSPTGIATINSTGVVTGVKAGSTTATATLSGVPL